MDKWKRIKEIREWFDLSKYDEANFFSNMDWYVALSDRSEIFDCLDHYYKLSLDAEQIKKELESEGVGYRHSFGCASRQPVSIEDMEEAHWEDNLFEGMDGHPCISVFPLSLFEAQDMVNTIRIHSDADLLGELEVDVVEDIVDSKFRRQPFDKFLVDQIGYHHGQVALNVNLYASDSDILSEIKSALPVLRRLISTDDSRFLTGEKSSEHRISIKKLSEYRVLACLDLMIWGKIELNPLKNWEVAELVFPGDGSITDSTIKDTVLPYALRAIDGAEINAFDLNSSILASRNRWKKSQAKKN